MHKYGIAWLLLVVTAVSAQEDGVDNYPLEETNSTVSEDCEHSNPGILSEHDRLIVSITQVLDQIADNLTIAEQDFLADLLDNDSCPDETVEHIIEEYERGTLHSRRQKRGTCEVQCRGVKASVRCSGDCKCQCNWFGRPKCKCCGWFC